MVLERPNTFKETGDQKCIHGNQPESCETCVIINRRKQARRVLSDKGHIDFSSSETSVHPALLYIGETEEGRQMTADEYIKLYLKTYGNGRDEKFLAEEMLQVAESTFGEQSSNPRLDLLAELKERLSDNKEKTQKEFDSSDPLIGTEYEGVPDEELWFGQTLYDEKGQRVNVGEPGYREAFLQYTKLNKMI